MPTNTTNKKVKAISTAKKETPPKKETKTTAKTKASTTTAKKTLVPKTVKQSSAKAKGKSAATASKTGKKKAVVSTVKKGGNNCTCSNAPVQDVGASGILPPRIPTDSLGPVTNDNCAIHSVNTSPSSSLAWTTSPVTYNSGGLVSASEFV